ncbi:MAG: hypothetical protein K2L33_00215, partial [Muribaculaceae bacterium]|nr:hypothetical protein [Muribaculaceae bacterium]
MEWTDDMIDENRLRHRRLKKLAHNPVRPRRGVSDAERMREDFEFWAARCVRIKHQATCRYVPFVLNRALRKVLDAMERQRRAGEPIRVIVLKSRQWGCSTLISYY